MKVTRIEVGPFNVNCYVVVDEDAGEAIIIDPGVGTLEIIRLLKGLKVNYILNTHGHFDHVGGNTFVKSGTHAPLVIHKEDTDMLSRPERNLSGYFGVEPTVSVPADIVITDDNFTFQLGKYTFQALHFPGHSPGNVGYYDRESQVLFSGDFIFHSTIGRIDLPGGNINQMRASIKKVLELPGNTLIYPGHEDPFLLSEFKKIAPVFLKEEV